MSGQQTQNTRDDTVSTGESPSTGRLLTLLLFEENTVLKKNRRHIKPVVRLQRYPIPSLKHPLAPTSRPPHTGLAARPPSAHPTSFLIPAHARLHDTVDRARKKSVLTETVLSPRSIPRGLINPVHSLLGSQEALHPVSSLSFAVV